jgi:predicted transcriptional regulator
LKRAHSEQPLIRFAKQSPSNALRELAQIALARGHSQYSLARLLNRSPANIRHYFESAKPRESTIADVGNALGLNPNYVRLLVKQELQPSELEDAEISLSDELRAAEHKFKPNARSAMMKYIRACSARRRHDLLLEYVMAAYRSDEKIAARVFDWPADISASLGVVADKALPEFDFRRYLRQDERKYEAAFLDLYLWCVSHNASHGFAEDILDLVRLRMRQGEIPYVELDEYLSADTSYRAGKWQHETFVRTIARERKP